MTELDVVVTQPPAGFDLDPSVVATLDHIRTTSIPRNTLRALESDVRYMDAWSRAATGAALPFPIPPELILMFIAHHLYDAAYKLSNPDHGMPAEVERALMDAGVKAQAGPHSPATVKRRLANVARLHAEKGADSPTSHPRVRRALADGTRLLDRPAQHKSEVAITHDVLGQLLSTCKETPFGIRDRAILLWMWSSGGRRRSEAASLTYDQLQPVDDGFLILLRGTKTRQKSQEKPVPLIGSAGVAMQRWLEVSAISSGRVFRSINRAGKLRAAISENGIARMIKVRARRAGLDPVKLSAHGIRAGFLTEAARRGIPIADAMDMSDHKDLRSVQRYWRAETASRNPAARMADDAEV